MSYQYIFSANEEKFKEIKVYGLAVLIKGLCMTQNEINVSPEEIRTIFTLCLCPETICETKNE